jgi:hypothetical protein
MLRRNRRRLSLESLEARRLMAVDLDFDGLGKLVRIGEDSAGQSGPVTMLVDRLGKLNVKDGDTDLGTYRVSPNLFISLGNVNPGLINVLQLDGHTLKTNLFVQLGDQAPDAPPTQFRTLGGRIDAADTGKIKGSVSAQAGTGDQFFIFGEQGKVLRHVTNITGSLHVDMGPGGEAGGAPEAVGSVGSPPSPAVLNVRRDVFVRNSTIFVMAGSVGGNLRVESPEKVGTIPWLGTPGQLVTLGNFGRPLSIGGNAVVRTGGGADSISTENATINGSLFVYSGAGDDLLELANIDASNDPTNDPSFVNAPARVRRDVFLFLGAGDDQVDIGDESGATTVRFRVGGNLFVYGEDGNDAINFINLKLEGGEIHLDAGEGNDTVSLSRVSASRAHLFALLGGGDDAFHVNAASVLSLKRLTAVGGTGQDDLELGNLDSFAFPRSFLEFET